MPSDNLIGLVNLTVDNQDVTPCWNVNKGINISAKAGSAPFRLDATFVYTANGKVQSELKSVAIKDTIDIGAFDNTTVLVEAKFTLAAKPDTDTNITLTTQIAHGLLSDGKGDPVGEPAVGTFPVKPKA